MISAAQAVESLIREYGALVFHTIYGFTGDWQESEDLTQETFSHELLQTKEDCSMIDPGREGSISASPNLARQAQCGRSRSDMIHS